ncbi:MAG: winged helix-turn-helix domain-containing protein [Nitrosotalea sp.]
MKKKEIQRIDWDIAKRLIEFLYYSGKERKTKIAMKCSLNYEQLTMYLDWLELLEFIIKEMDHKRIEWISLSERGIDFYLRKLRNIQSCGVLEFRSQMRNLSV